MGIRRRRWRIRAAGDGFDLNLPAEERELLTHLLPQLREVMESGQWREPRFSQQHAVT